MLKAYYIFEWGGQLLRLKKGQKSIHRAKAFHEAKNAPHLLQQLGTVCHQK